MGAVTMTSRAGMGIPSNCPRPGAHSFCNSFSWRKGSDPWPVTRSREDLRQWRGDRHPRAYQEPRQKSGSGHTPDLPATAGKLRAQAGGGAEAAARDRGRAEATSPGKAAAAGRSEPVRPGRPLPPPRRKKPCCDESDPRPELQRCTEADRKSRTRHPRASQRQQRATPTRRDSAARPPHETALEPSRGSAASPQGPAQLRPAESSPAPMRVA